MKSNNPVLSKYEKAATSGAGGLDAAFQQVTAGGGARLTINDVVIKSLGLFAITVVFAVIGWNLVASMPWILWVGLIGGLVFGFWAALKKSVSPPLIMLYAVFEGVMLGAISNWYDTYAQVANEYQGIVLQAVVATMTTFGIMLVLYLTGVIKVTRKFQSVLMVAVVSYLVLGLASLIASFFGVGGGWGFYGVSGLGLIICVAGVLIAAFFLLLDFEAINQGIRLGAPENESWRMAMGLLMTLIWLYLEFLRLLAIFSRN